MENFSRNKHVYKQSVWIIDERSRHIGRHKTYISSIGPLTPNWLIPISSPRQLAVWNYRWKWYMKENSISILVITCALRRYGPHKAFFIQSPYLPSRHSYLFSRSRRRILSHQWCIRWRFQGNVVESSANLAGYEQQSRENSKHETCEKCWTGQIVLHQLCRDPVRADRLSMLSPGQSVELSEIANHKENYRGYRVNRDAVLISAALQKVVKWPYRYWE